MTKITLMGAGSAGTSHGQNYHSGGQANNKWQGLPATRNSRTGPLLNHIRSQAGSTEEQRRAVFYFNALGGVGKLRTQFIPGGGGVFDPDKVEDTASGSVFWDDDGYSYAAKFVNLKDIAFDLSGTYGLPEGVESWDDVDIIEITRGSVQNKTFNWNGPFKETTDLLIALSDPAHPVFGNVIPTWNGYTSSKGLYGQIAALLRSYKTTIPDNNENYLYTSAFPDYMLFDPRGVGIQYESSNNQVYRTLDQKDHFNTILDPSSSIERLLYKTGTFLTKHSAPAHIGTDVSAQVHDTLSGALETTYIAHYNQIQEKIENDDADASFNSTSSGPGVFTTIGGNDMKDINKAFLKGLVSNSTLANVSYPSFENDQSVFNKIYPESELRLNAGNDIWGYNPRSIKKNGNRYISAKKHFNTSASYDVRNNIRYILIDKKDNYSIREEDPSYQTSYNIYKSSKQGEAFVYGVEMSPDANKWMNWDDTVNGVSKYKELFDPTKVVTRQIMETVAMLKELYDDYQKTNIPLNFGIGDVKVIGKVKDIYNIYTDTPWKPYDSSGSSSNILSGDSIADSSGGFGTFVSIAKGDGEYVAVASRERVADKMRFYKTTTTTDNKTDINLLESNLVKDRFPISEASGNNIISISDYLTGYTPVAAVGLKNATRPSFAKSGPSSIKGGYVELFGNDDVSSVPYFSVKTEQSSTSTGNYTELYGEVEGDAYGNSVAIAGSIGTSAMMAVGAPDASGGIGHTYVYQIGGSTGGNVLVENVFTGSLTGISSEQAGVYTLDAFVGDSINKNYGYSVDVAKMTDNSFVVVSGAPSYSDTSGVVGDIRYMVFDQFGNKVQDVSNVWASISSSIAGSSTFAPGSQFGSQVSLSETGEFLAISAPKWGTVEKRIYMKWNTATSKYNLLSTKTSSRTQFFSIVREQPVKYLNGTTGLDYVSFISSPVDQKVDFVASSSWTRKANEQIVSETNPASVTDKKGAGLAVGKNGNIVVIGAPQDGKGSVEVLQMPYPKLDLTITRRQVGNDMSCPDIGGTAGTGEYGYRMTIDALAKHYAISGPGECGKWTSSNDKGWVDIYDVSGANIDNYTEVASFVNPWYLNETKNASGQYPSSGGTTYQAAVGGWMTDANSKLPRVGAGMGSAIEYSGDGKVLIVGLPNADKISGGATGSTGRGAIYVVEDRGPASGLRFGNRAFHHQARLLVNGSIVFTHFPKAYLTPNEAVGIDASANFGFSVSSNYDGSVIASTAFRDSSGVLSTTESFAEVLYYNTARSPPLYEYRKFKASGSNVHREPGYIYCSLSNDGNRVALSNPNYDISGGNANVGIVSVFEWDEANTVYQKIGGDIVGTSANEALGSHIRLSPSGKVVVIGSGDPDAGLSNGDIASYTLYEGNTGTWTKVFDTGTRFSGRTPAVGSTVYKFSTSGYHSEEIAYIDPTEFPNGAKINFMSGNAYEDYHKVGASAVLTYNFTNKTNAYSSGFQKATTASSFNAGTSAEANVVYPDGAGDGAVANTLVFSKFNSSPSESIATLVTDIY